MKNADRNRFLLQRLVNGFLVVNASLEGGAHGDHNQGRAPGIKDLFKGLDIHLSLYICLDQPHIQVLQVAQLLDGIVGFLRDVQDRLFLALGEEVFDAEVDPVVVYGFTMRLRTGSLS